ncbi:MAG: acetolactate synthase small subunit [Deltaproteobacteria bacterium]|nr:acetolactate synthase small subunit [Deltaproteobacteria bacterium]
MPSEKLHTLSVFSENSPGVLHRLTVIFTRRKLNIESLTVSETERKGVSRFTIVVRSDEDTILKVAKQLERIIEVLQVNVFSNGELLFKEIALYRVAADSPAKRSEIEEVARRYGAQMLNLSPSAVVLEKTGSEDDVNSLYLLLEPFGIREFVRSGRIAIAKNHG